MENAAGGFDPNLQVMSSSTLGFEWSFGSGGAQDRDVVLVRCDNAFQQGVPAPVAFGKIQPRAVDQQKTDFEKFAAAAVVPEKCQAFRRNLGDPSLQVLCKCLLHTCVYAKTNYFIMLILYNFENV